MHSERLQIIGHAPDMMYHSGHMGNTASDFTEGGIAGKLVRFMLPILGALLLQAAYGATDLLMVGLYGTTEGLSGVSTGSGIMNLATFVITGFATGITVLLGNFIGSRNTEKAGKMVGQAMLFFLIMGISATALLMILAEPFARLMRAPDEAIASTAAYVRICGSGMLAIIAYNVISCIFRALGNSRLPLLFIAVSCIANIVGDYILVAIFGMDAAGAAIATVGSQILAAIIAAVAMIRSGLPFRIRTVDFRPGRELISLIRVGSPIALQEMMTQLASIAVLAIINNLGLAASGGYGVAGKVVTFAMLIPSSAMQALSSFVAQNAGAGRDDRAQSAMVVGMGISAAVGLIMFVPSFFFGDELSRLFTPDAAVVACSASYLRGVSPDMVITAVLFGFMGYFSGHARTLFVMAQALMQTLLVRLPLSYIISLQPDPSLVLMGLAAPLTTLFGIALNAGFFIWCMRRPGNRSRMPA